MQKVKIHHLMLDYQKKSKKSLEKAHPNGIDKNRLNGSWFGK